MKSLIRIIIVALLLSSFFGCKGQNKGNPIPPEKFSIVESKLNNGKPIIGSINMAYKNFDRKSEYPWCLKINIALDLKNVNKNGLPLKSESDIANKFEDELCAEVNKLANAHYIGHFYNDTFLDVYIYLDNPEKVHQYLQTQINKKGIARPFAYEIKKDENWNTVKPFMK